MYISEKETLTIEKSISFRGRISQLELKGIGQQIESILQDTLSNRVGRPVTATFSIENDIEKGQIMDMELLVPVDKDLSTLNMPKGFCFKKDFYLTNAVKLHHVGHPAKLQESINELNNYISEHRMVPITAGYNVTLNEPKTPLELETAEVDVYVGISLNRL